MRRSTVTTRRSVLQTSRKLLVALAVTASLGGGALVAAPAQAEPAAPRTSIRVDAVEDAASVDYEGIHETAKPLNPRPAPQQESDRP